MKFKCHSVREWKPSSKPAPGPALTRDDSATSPDEISMFFASERHDDPRSSRIWALRLCKILYLARAEFDAAFCTIVGVSLGLRQVREFGG